MKKAFIFLSALVCAVLTCSAQENKINRIPEKGYDVNQQRYYEYDRGFWFGAEAMYGYSCHTHGHNMGFAEIDLTAGYRFSQFFKIGVGTGPRHYISQKSLRRHDTEWAMPIFGVLRGNLMPGKYRRVVPYYSVEAGGVLGDGFMIRPSLGIRIGEPREAFTLAVSYMGQDISTWNSKMEKAFKYTNFAAIRLGYEF